ncbi:MAG: hypothetical protein E6G76_14115 [Alphaproteobacteria bacterium]|nr:MAG: hypothetical protein E6G76_14115 [Alphaproteobacteria bacterium]
MNPLNASQSTMCGLAWKRYFKANAAPQCGARSKRTGKPCRASAMPNGRCEGRGGKSTGPRTPEGLERSRRANWNTGSTAINLNLQVKAMVAQQHRRWRARLTTITRELSGPRKTGTRAIAQSRQQIGALY